MKKIFAVGFLAMLLINHNASAQKEIVIWHGLNAELNEGQNSCVIKNGQGTIMFMKTGNNFSNVRYLDSAGKTHILSLVKSGTGGAQPECKYPIPGACFASADKSLEFCVCTPTGTPASATLTRKYQRKSGDIAAFN